MSLPNRRTNQKHDVGTKTLDLQLKQKRAYQLLEGQKVFNEIFSVQKKRIYKAFSNSDASEVISFDNVLKKIINGKI